MEITRVILRGPKFAFCMKSEATHKKYYTYIQENCIQEELEEYWLLLVEIKMRMPHDLDLLSCGYGLKRQNSGRAIKGKQASVRDTITEKKYKDGLEFYCKIVNHSDRKGCEGRDRKKELVDVLGMPGICQPCQLARVGPLCTGIWKNYPLFSLPAI